jgi:hypothetical protein
LTAEFENIPIEGLEIRFSGNIMEGCNLPAEGIRPQDAVKHFKITLTKIEKL